MPLPARVRTAFMRVGALFFVLLLLMAAGLAWYFHPPSEITRGVVYGSRHGKELTLEIHRPQNPCGIGIIVMVSGKWKSHPGKFRAWLAAPLLRRGMTVFAVSHLPQPEASVQEIVQDAHRSVRFVRHHAQRYGVDPQRLGVTGGSSGGHLALMLATRGSAGLASGTDPVDREDSSVQAVAVFFPVTDLLNLGTSTENDGTGGPPRSFKRSFGPEASDMKKWAIIGREVSPIFHIHERLPPTFIVHGSGDTLVPLEQSERYLQRAAELGKNVELHITEGAGHGWPSMVLFEFAMLADWLKQQLTRA